MASIGYVRMEEVPGIPVLPKSPAAVVYAPLGDTPVDPDVVLFSGPAARLMLLQEAAIRAGIASKLNTLGRPTCMVLPAALASGMVASTGCVGNRVYTAVAEGDLYAAVPGTDLARACRHDCDHQLGQRQAAGISPGPESSTVIPGDRMNGRFFRGIALFPLLLLAALALPASVHAQSAANSAQIVGSRGRSDAGGSRQRARDCPQHSTNYERSVVTDEAGRYAFTQLPLGPYEVSVNAPGFEAARQQVTLTLASVVTADFNLSVSGVALAALVTVPDFASEPTRSAPKSVLTDLQIHNLPSNGRRIQNMVMQTPTTLIEPECSGFSVAGQKGIYANLLIDGGDYNSTWQCGVRSRSSSAPSFGFEALQEIQVVRNSFSSEFGRSTGGLITLSTRSGTNQIRGTSFYLGRDGSFASSDAFGREPSATVHQFGASVGGPIRQDRTFFFTAAEFQEGSKASQVTYAGIDRVDGGRAALLAIAPEEELRRHQRRQVGDQPHRPPINDNNMFLGRFDFTRTYTANSPGATALQTGLGIASTTTSAKSNLLLTPSTNYTTLGAVDGGVSSATRLNELRVQLGREVRPRTYQGEGPQVTIGNAAVYGPPSSGSWGNVGFASEDNRYHLVDNFSVVSGAHTTKVGVDFLRMAGHALYNQQFNGAYTFSSLADVGEPDADVVRAVHGHRRSGSDDQPAGVLRPGRLESGAAADAVTRASLGRPVESGLRGGHRAGKPVPAGDVDSRRHADDRAAARPGVGHDRRRSQHRARRRRPVLRADLHVDLRAVVSLQRR